MGCLPPQLCLPPHHCLAAHCLPCLLEPCCSGCIPARVSFSPLALGDVRGCWGCCAWRWLGAETWVEIFESTGFEFLAVSALPPTAFRCQLNRQRQSRDHGGPDRTLVCIQPTPSAQAVPSPTKPLPKKGEEVGENHVDGRVAAAAGFETKQPLYELWGLPTPGKPAPRAILPPQGRSLPVPSRFANFEN